MKKILLISLVTLFSLPSFSQFAGDGYYRVQNRDTKRYLTVIDDRASVNVATTDVDLAAILPIKSFDRIAGNPASIIYIDNVSGNNYSLRAQNVDTYDLMGVYLNLTKRDDGTYFAHATSHGVTKYLCDEKSSRDEGWLMTGTQNRNWYIIPVNSSSDNYFAAVPEFEHEGAYYTTMYASFPYQNAAKGMEVYYVSKVDNSVAVVKEIENGVVPTSTPVIIKCMSENHADNKLNIISGSVSEISSNLLGGVYFNNSNKVHWNRKEFDPNTMRVLGVTSDGSLGFVLAPESFKDKKDGKYYLPANKAYLNVPAGSPEEIKLITEEEYETGIGEVESNEAESGVYFDLSGRRVSNPRNGVYVSAKGKKICM